MSNSSRLSRWRSTLQELGVGELIRYAPEYLTELWRHRRDDFDRRLGTETNRSVAVAGLGLDDQTASTAELYWPVREAPFREMMAAIAPPHGRFCFVDIGCGKGRALILALEAGVGQAIGVECSVPLCDVARRNLACAARTVPSAAEARVECGDAAAFEFPLQPLLVFFFDPFGPPLLDRVVARLAESLQQHPRECHVMYYLPMHLDVFLRAGFEVRVQRRRHWSGTYPWAILTLPNGPRASARSEA